MSDSEEDNVYYGTPLEPYDEDAFPKKKPISIEEQVARDAQGRRRFHGAFTGGFSAGFFNTVGSLEGWRPSDFKSSRSDKAQNRQQRPEDYMDDEDLGEFGIAPQTVRATDDYSTSKKRKKKVFADGPIPGDPVLDTLLQAGNETVGYFLMRNMNRKKKEDKTGPKVYGCVMPTDEPEEVVEVPQYNLHEMYKQCLTKPKCNSFGLGHVGLNKSHLNLFQPAKLAVRERNNKKLSISGQAFGVGAFEEDDDDIYVKDDMSRYDFELTAESSKKEPTQKVTLIMDLFVQSNQVLHPQNNFPPPVIPSSFSGKHNIKKSRFEPVPEASAPERPNIDASLRAKYLGEDDNKSYTPSGTQHKRADRNDRNKKPENKMEKRESEMKTEHSSNILKDMFVSSTLDEDPTNILEPVKKTETPHGTEEMHAAVKMKMFGPLTRVTLDWQPCSFLCRRFNVPEPNFELTAQKNKKRTKHLIFEYQKHAETVPDLKPGLSIQNDSSAISTTLPAEVNPPPSSEPPAIKEEPSLEPSTSNSNQIPSSEEAEESQVIDITDKLDVAKNTDLFKAVFLSSSESESEEEDEKETEQKRREIFTNVVSEPLVPKIKSTKEGILSNIDFSKFQARRSEPEQRSEHERPSESETKEPKRDENTYGPKLPESIPKNNGDQKPKVAVVESVNCDEWVEKDSTGRKHKKKHKNKEKERHKKKHKHKSKR